MLVVDVSDTTQAPTGTTKKMTTANLFTSPSMTTVTVASGGIAVTGDSTITGTLGVTGALTASAGVTIAGGNFAAGTLTKSTVNGLLLSGATGSTYDCAVVSPSGVNIISIPTGTVNVVLAGTLGVTGNVAINTSKFTVAAASGNTAVAGTLAVTGAITATGGVAGALNVTGDFTVATNKLVVSASTGNLALIGDISASAGAAQIALTVAFGGLGASYGWLNCKTTAGVTTATVISPNNTFAKGGVALVYGSDGTNKFSDLVHYGTTTATAVAAQTLAGAPAARTYTMASNTLKLAMASGTYSIETTEMYKGT